MADTNFDIIIIGSGPGRLCLRHPRRAARFYDRHRRARLSGRHLPELGLHPDQGAAALGGDFSLHAARQGLRACRRARSLTIRSAVVKRSRAVAKRLNDGVGFLMKKNKVAVIWGEADDRRARQNHREGRQERSAEGRARARRVSGQAHHRRHRRAAARAARHRAGQETGLDLFRGHGAGPHAEVAAGHRLRRHRHRIRLVLSHARRRGDGRRGAAANPARRRTPRSPPSRAKASRSRASRFSPAPR